MRSLRTIIILTLAMALSAGMALAQPPDLASKMQGANADLDRLTQDLTKLLTHPGFLGFLRSEIVKSKNRENILELGKFLDRAAKKSGMPPGLMKFKDSARNVRGRLKASGLTAFEGLDLYIPVDAHRAKWKGGKDLYVASAPLGDEKQIKQIVAYQVRDGKRALLDANRAPQTPVLIVAHEEHKTHVVQPLPMKKGPVPPENPKPHFKGKDPPAPKGMKEPGGGNSRVGLHYVKIFTDREPWYCGSPEIDIQFFQRKGNICERKYSWCDRINNTNTWYNTWSYTSNASPLIKHYFDNNYWNRLYVYINEQDAFGHRSPSLVQLYSGITCEVYRWSNDDWVDSTFQWRWNLSYDRDYYHHIGNAYIVWYKTH